MIALQLTDRRTAGVHGDAHAHAHGHEDVNVNVDAEVEVDGVAADGSGKLVHARVRVCKPKSPMTAATSCWEERVRESGFVC